MDQDDPEKRIAELERVPGEPSVAARKRPGIEQSLQFSDSDTQPIALPGVVTDRHARRRALWAMHAQRGQAMAAQAARKQRRSHRTEKLIGWIFVVVAGVLGIPFVAAVVLAIVVPSSTQWMSGIVCSSPYHLEHDISHHSYKPGQSTSTVSYECVSAEGSYDVNDSVVWALQSLLIALVLCPVVTVGLLMWRRMRKHR